jgi:hypothetical protein
MTSENRNIYLELFVNFVCPGHNSTWYLNDINVSASEPRALQFLQE